MDQNGSPGHPDPPFSRRCLGRSTEKAFHRHLPQNADGSGGGIAGGALGLGITAGGGYALSALAPSLLGTAAAGAAIPGVNILVAGAAIGVAIGAGISALFSLF